MSDLSRITVDKDICHGKPCVRHMRWPVEVVLDMVASGMGIDEILTDHPELEREDVVACLQYARESCYIELSREGAVVLPGTF